MDEHPYNGILLSNRNGKYIDICKKYTDYITMLVNLKELCNIKETYLKGYILLNFTYRHSGKRKVVRTE